LFDKKVKVLDKEDVYGTRATETYFDGIFTRS
jgi:hypothetical protein